MRKAKDKQLRPRGSYLSANKPKYFQIQSLRRLKDYKLGILCRKSNIDHILVTSTRMERLRLKILKASTKPQYRLTEAVNNRRCFLPVPDSKLFKLRTILSDPAEWKKYNTIETNAWYNSKRKDRQSTQSQIPTKKQKAW